MQKDTLAALISKTSIVMQNFERRSQGIEQHLQTLAIRLETVTQQMPAVLKQSADGTLRNLPPQVVDQVRLGLQSPMEDYQHRLDAAGHEVRSSSHALAKQIQEMQSLHQRLIWKAVGVTAGCLALLLVGGIWLSMHYISVIRENQLSAELMKVYNGADVTLCDGHLCANVDAKSKRYGSKGEYQPVKDR